MTTLTDILTVGLVLVLLFGSIALYLYTRIQQAEQKISLLEGILLDLKMGSEVKSYTELPAHEVHAEPYVPYEDVHFDNPADSNNKHQLNDEVDVEEYKSVVAQAVVLPDIVMDVNQKVNYESMTLKELQSLAKSRELTGTGSMKKGQLIDALKALEKPVEAGSIGSSFIETSASIDV